MKKFIEETGARYDITLFDSPPLVAVTDPVLLVPAMDGIIQVVRGNKTSKKIIRRGSQILNYAKSRTIGLVLNNVDTRSGYYYYYYRGYYYKGYYK
jgi:Mrp family chromosome partitioning ATPase